MATDKERIVLLEEKVKGLQEEHEEWKKLICGSIRHVLYGAMGLLASGFLYGWHLPDMARKALADWISR